MYKITKIINITGKIINPKNKNSIINEIPSIKNNNPTKQFFVVKTLIITLSLQ